MQLGFMPVKYKLCSADIAVRFIVSSKWRICCTALGSDVNLDMWQRNEVRQVLRMLHAEFDKFCLLYGISMAMKEPL
jgi:hypothetical protein